MSKPLPALVSRILNNAEPTITTDELKWLAEEYARLHRQATEGENDIPSPPDTREALRRAVEGEDR